MKLMSEYLNFKQENKTTSKNFVGVIEQKSNKPKELWIWFLKHVINHDQTQRK